MSESIVETKVLSGFAVQTMINEIEIQKVSGKGVVEAGPHLFYITEAAESIPPFPFPLQAGGDIYVDARGFTALEKDQVTFKVRDPITEQFMKDLSYLELNWLSLQNKESFFYLSMDAMVHYVRWIAENVSHHFRMDFNEKMRLSACVALYYVGLFNNHIEGGLQETQLRRTITKHLPISEEALDYVLAEQDIKFPRTIDEFCTFVVKANVSLQLASFNPLVLNNIMSRTLFGIGQPKMVISMAMEHPPAWYAVMTTVLDNNFLKRSIVGEQLYRDRQLKEKFPTTIQRHIERVKEQ